MSTVKETAFCELTTISDYILAYTVEGLIILWGLLILSFILGFIWIIKTIWEKLFEF